MNILFYLTPKSEVDYVNENDSLHKALETMEIRNYNAIPVINKSGSYVGTITAGDILGFIKQNHDLNYDKAKKVKISIIKRVRDNKPVNANAKIEDLIDKIVIQNFVPVVDDKDNFIGIITRKDIMSNWNKISDNNMPMEHAPIKLHFVQGGV